MHGRAVRPCVRVRFLRARARLAAAAQAERAVLRYMPHRNITGQSLSGHDVVSHGLAHRTGMYRGRPILWLVWQFSPVSDADELSSIPYAEKPDFTVYQ